MRVWLGATALLAAAGAAVTIQPSSGQGVNAACEMKVVSCNYAHLYSGAFSWTSSLASPGSSYHEQVQVKVVRGVAVCSGQATESGNGQSRSAPIAGSGLIAVEFVEDSARRLVYRVTVACPTPAWPALNNDPATPSRPAELGQNEQGSYNQPATRIEMPLLNGSYSNPSPDSDRANGVTGTVSVHWNLIHQ